MREAIRPVWSEINLDNLRDNILEVQNRVSNSTKICAVVKADAYGHGAIAVARTAVQAGVDLLAVATLSEAIELRHHFSEIPILILGYTPASSCELLLEHGIIQSVYDFEQLEIMNQIAENKNQTLKVHIKIDTGMTRLGFKYDENPVESVKKIIELSNIRVEGIFSHFACADEVDPKFSHLQAKRFMDIVSELETQGVHIPIKHICNSAGLINFPEYHFDMVRAGIILYGLYPSKSMKDKITLKAVLELKAKISNVNVISSNEGVSYGQIYKAVEKTKIATLPIGYADGFIRAYSKGGKISYQNEYFPLVGRICMDQCMVNIGSKDVAIGDTVTIMGGNNRDACSVDDYATISDSINYEVVCLLGRRIPKIYFKNGEIDHSDF